MDQIKKKIENIMDGKAQESSSLLSHMLYALSLGYGGAVGFRNYLHNANLLKTKKLPCKTISVGNLCIGGTGKTPMAIYIARLLHEKGMRVCIVSRGYKGKAENEGGIVSDTKQILMSPDQAGDEPFMMAQTLKGVPVLVGKDRYESGMTAVNQFGAEVIVLDDAFQHRQLSRDVDLILLDGKIPFGNGRLIPRGRLREPVDALARGHAIVFTRTDKNRKATSKFISTVQQISGGGPIFYTEHQPYIADILYNEKKENERQEFVDTSNFCFLQHKRVIGFSGIAVNDNFKHTIEGASAEIADFFEFPDHHFYSEKDLKKIYQAVKHTKAHYLVTTEKDFIKLPKDLSMGADLVVVGININMGEDEKSFEQFLINAIS